MSSRLEKEKALRELKWLKLYHQNLFLSLSLDSEEYSASIVVEIQKAFNFYYNGLAMNNTLIETLCYANVDRYPKNSIETMKAIEQIPHLEKEIDEIMYEEFIKEEERLRGLFDYFGDSDVPALYKPNPISYETYKSMLGRCHHYWGIKKSLLKEKYGIIWYTPHECDPFTCYD